MLLEVEWPEVRQMAKRAPFWLLLLDQTWQAGGVGGLEIPNKTH